MAHCLLSVIRITTLLATNSSIHAEEPEWFEARLKQLNLAKYELKIAQISQKFKRNADLQNLASKVISSLSKKMA